LHQGWYVSEVYTTLARDARLDGLSVVNTVGVALPRAVGFIFCKLGEWLPGVPLEFYTHNEFGIQTTDDQAEEIMNRVKYEGRVQKSPISGARFAGICREVLR